MGALIVDWLGQGGIFQTSRAWARVLVAEGLDPVVLTRSGGETFADDPVRPVTRRSARLVAHVELVRAAVAEIVESQPSVVVVQNYLVPALERAVFRAARRVGARTVFVVHNDRPHSSVAGMSLGLGGLLAGADAVLTHSRYVADRLATSRPVQVIDHPVPVGLVDLADETSPVSAGGDTLTALTFGVLKRQYKGTSVVEEVARRGVPGWRFVAAGVGAPVPGSVPGLETLPGFVPAERLVELVRSADVCLLPYRHATQSGAVALAHALGTPVVVTAVGGIPEQVQDHVNGRLVLVGAPAAAWADALRELNRPALQALGERGRHDAWARHARFSERAIAVVTQ